MAEFRPALIEVLDVEAGYVNKWFDHGGATNWGITEATARSYGYEGDMKDLPSELAERIYREGYWDRVRGDDLVDQDIANEIFEAGVNSGIFPVSRYVQRAVNVFNRTGKDWADIKVDGQIGPNTVKIINIASSKRKLNLWKALNVFQGMRYIEIAEKYPNQELNINGWFSKRVELQAGLEN